MQNFSSPEESTIYVTEIYPPKDVVNTYIYIYIYIERERERERDRERERYRVHIITTFPHARSWLKIQ